MGKKPWPLEDESIKKSGTEKLYDYQAAGFTLQNAGAGFFRRSGAQAILPDGTATLYLETLAKKLKNKCF